MARCLCRIGLFLAVEAVAVSGCRRNADATPHCVMPTTVSLAPPASLATVSERAKRCGAQGARLAARGMSLGGSNDGHDTPLRSVTHYSEKYDHCYVLVDRLFPTQTGAAPVVSELWDAFEADVLAEYTDDPRSAIRRRFCEVFLSDDPLTSCAVARYFIDEHMQH